MQSNNPYAIPVGENQGRKLAKNWLLVGVMALALSGLIALILVIGRTTELLVIKDVFHVALVVHVDLSVLVWFLAITGMLWQLATFKNALPYFQPAALICFALGSLLLAFSPFLGEGNAYMSNYIPVLGNGAFILSLSLLACGMIIQAIPTILNPPSHKEKTFVAAQRFGIVGAAWIILTAIFAFVLSYRELPPEIIEEQRYELLFWGGGHILQFAYVQILVVAWLWLAGSLNVEPRISIQRLHQLYIVGPILCVIWLTGVYIHFDVTDAGHREGFTHLMQYGNGVVPFIVAIFIAASLIRTPIEKWHRAYASCLWTSLIMFSVGGAMGGLIHGVNTIIPAHYHGSIVGLTIGFMGLAYLLLPEFGYAPVAHTRLAFWQPIIYGVGQLMHVSGLAWGGGYGVMRKTPGVVEGGLSAARGAKYLIQWGGVLAILGGVLFVWVVARSLLQARKAQA